MNALAILKRDHQTVKALFKQYQAAGDSPSKAKQRLAEQITRELSVHASIEEQVLYPRQGPAKRSWRIRSSRHWRNITSPR